MKVHYPKLYNMAHLLASNVLLLPKDLTIIFIFYIKVGFKGVYIARTCFPDGCSKKYTLLYSIRILF